MQLLAEGQLLGASGCGLQALFGQGSGLRTISETNVLSCCNSSIEPQLRQAACQQVVEEQ